MSPKLGRLPALSRQQAEVRANQGSFAVAFVLLSKAPGGLYTTIPTPNQRQWLGCSRIPAMVDHSTDKPVRVFESGSILMHPVGVRFHLASGDCRCMEV